MTFACGGQRKAPAPYDCIKDAARSVGPNECHCPAWGSGIGRELFPLGFEIFPQPGLFAGL